MDNVLWEIATGILAYVARMKAKLGIQPFGSKVVMVLCLLTMVFILINENIAYVLSIAAVVLSFVLGTIERRHLKKQLEKEATVEK